MNRLIFFAPSRGNFSKQLFTPHWDTLKPWKVSRVGLATPAGGPTANFSKQLLMTIGTNVFPSPRLRFFFVGEYELKDSYSRGGSSFVFGFLSLSVLRVLRGETVFFVVKPGHLSQRTPGNYEQAHFLRAFAWELFEAAFHAPLGHPETMESFSCGLWQPRQAVPPPTFRSNCS